MINTKHYNLQWNTPLNVPDTLTLGQIKLLYINGYYLIDTELDSKLSFTDISFRIASYGMC